MAILLRDFSEGASPEPKVGQQIMQVRQRRNAGPRFSKGHLPAGDRVTHPRRHDGDHAEGDLDMEYLAVRALLSVLPAQAAPKQRVPAIVDDNFSPDMGRMSP